jgi:hypothetical protein
VACATAKPLPTFDPSPTISPIKPIVFLVMSNFAFATASLIAISSCALFLSLSNCSSFNNCSL